MKDFKPMRELINALLAIAEAIKGESQDSGQEVKNNKIIGLNCPDKILVWAMESSIGESEQTDDRLEYQYVDTYQEVAAFMNNPNYSDWAKNSIFVYKNNDLNVDDTLMYSVYNGLRLPNCIMIDEIARYPKRFVKLSEALIGLDVSRIEDADKWYIIVQQPEEILDET